MSLSGPQHRTSYRGFLRRVCDAPCNILGRLCPKENQLKGKSSASSLATSQDSSFTTTADYHKLDIQPLPADHETKDFLRGVGAQLDARTLSSQSSMFDMDEYEDRKREGTSRRRSNNSPKTPPVQRIQQYSHDVRNWKVEEYDDPDVEQLPPIQYTEEKDGQSEGSLLAKDQRQLSWCESACSAPISSGPVVSDDTADTPWDAPSTAKRQNEVTTISSLGAAPGNAPHTSQGQRPQLSFPRQMSYPSYHQPQPSQEAMHSATPSSSHMRPSHPRKRSEKRPYLPPICRLLPHQLQHFSGQIVGASRRMQSSQLPPTQVSQASNRSNGSKLRPLQTPGPSIHAVSSLPQSPQTSQNPRTSPNQFSQPLVLSEPAPHDNRRLPPRSQGRPQLSQARKLAKPVHRAPAQALEPKWNANTTTSYHTPLLGSLQPSGTPQISQRHTSDSVNISDPQKLQHVMRPRLPNEAEPKRPRKHSRSQSMRDVPFDYPLTESKPQFPRERGLDDSQQHLRPHSSGEPRQGQLPKTVLPYVAQQKQTSDEPDPSLRNSRNNQNSTELAMLSGKQPTKGDTSKIREKNEVEETSLVPETDSSHELKLTESSDGIRSESMEEPISLAPPLPSPPTSPAMLRSPDSSLSSRPHTPPQAGAESLSPSSPEAQRIPDMSQTSPHTPSQTRSESSSPLSGPPSVQHFKSEGLNDTSRRQNDPERQSPVSPQCSLNGEGPVLELPQNNMKTLCIPSPPSQHTQNLTPSPSSQVEKTLVVPQNEEGSLLMDSASTQTSSQPDQSSMSQASFLALSATNRDAKSDEVRDVSCVSSSTTSTASQDSSPVALFEVRKVSIPPSRNSRYSNSSAPKTADELIRKSSKRKKPWEKEFDGIPKRYNNKWSKAVALATSQTLAQPNDKHVRTVLDGIRNGRPSADANTPAGAIILTLRDRFETPAWSVRLKAALFCHTIFRAANNKFVEYIARAQADLLDPKKVISDGAFSACEQGLLHKAFAEEYTRYLKTWLSMKQVAKFPVGRTTASSSRRFKTADPKDLLTSLPKLLDTLGCVAPLELYPEIEESPLADAAISLVLKDSKIIVNALDAGVNRLADLFPSLQAQSAQQVKALRVYGRYNQAVRDIRPVLHRMSGEASAWMGGLDLSPGMVDRMNTHFHSRQERGSPRQRIHASMGDAKQKGARVDTIGRRKDMSVNLGKAPQTRSVKKGKGRDANSVSEMNANSLEIFDEETQETEIVTPIDIDRGDLPDFLEADDRHEGLMAGGRATRGDENDDDFPLRSRYPSD